MTPIQILKSYYISIFIYIIAKVKAGLRVEIGLGSRSEKPKLKKFNILKVLLSCTMALPSCVIGPIKIEILSSLLKIVESCKEFFQ